MESRNSSKHRNKQAIGRNRLTQLITDDQKKKNKQTFVHFILLKMKFWIIIRGNRHEYISVSH